MCVICYKPATVAMPSDQEIRDMFSKNPDGAGLMYLTEKGYVEIVKGFFKVDTLLDYIHEHTILNTSELVLHFRIATSGKKDILNCHPYPVFKKNSSAINTDSVCMAHNGVLDGCGWKGNEEQNDTQMFIKELKTLPHNFLSNKMICKLISKSIGTNKLAFLDKNGIHLFGDFKEDDNGCFYSNKNHRCKINYSSPSYLSTYSFSKEPVKSEQTSMFAVDNDCDKIKANVCLSTREFADEVAKIPGIACESTIKMIGDKPVSFVTDDYWLYPDTKKRIINKYKNDDITNSELDDMFEQLFKGKTDVFLQPEEFCNIEYLVEKYKRTTSSLDMMMESFTAKNGDVIELDLDSGFIVKYSSEEYYGYKDSYEWYPA